MKKEEFLKRSMEIRMKIAFLKPEEKSNPNHPLFEKLKELRSEYASSLIIERESEIYGKHKRK